jgi:hypothetical protein
MRTPLPAPIFALAVALTAPGLASAQEPVKSFDQLNTRLKPGDTVWVTDAQGRELKGHVVELTPSSLVLDGRPPRSFGAGDVRAVKERAGSSIGKGALWGTLAGAGYGLVLALVNPREYAGYCSPEDPPDCFPPPGTRPPVDWWSVPAAAGLGAGLGAMVGALLPGTTREVYVAGGGADRSGSDVRMSIAPVVTPRAMGVTVSFAF